MKVIGQRPGLDISNWHGVLPPWAKTNCTQHL